MLTMRAAGATWETIGAAMDRAGASVCAHYHRIKDMIEVDGSPPSRAAIRLARHDPLMAECLARRGYAVE